MPTTDWKLTLVAVPEINLTATVADESTRPFSMVAYSGGKLFVNGFRHPVVVDLRGIEVRASEGVVPVTLDHQDDRRVGHGTVENTGKQLLMAGETSAETDHRDEVVRSARNGFRWQASIEGLVGDSETVKAGQSRFVNGRMHFGPFVLARKFALTKVSFVTSGGDSDNIVRLAAAEGEDDMELEELKSQVEDRDKRIVELEEKLEAAAKEPDRTESEPPPGDPVEQFRKDMEEGFLHAAMVRKVLGADHPDLAAKAIEEEWSKEKCELEVLRAQTRAPAVQVTDRTPSEDTFTVAEAALALQANVRKEILDDSYSQETLNKATEKDYQSYGLHALMYDTCRAAGEYVRAGVMNDDFIRSTLRSDWKLAASSGFSTIGISGVLENLANKTLLDAYRRYPMVASQVCGRKNVSDFKEVKMYRVSTLGLLEELGPNGEIKHTTLTESEFTASIDTYARMLAITRKHMINDDLGAFQDAAGQFGRIAGKTVDYVFHSAFIGNANSFFSAGNGNYADGAATVLEISSLTTAEKMFLDQSDDTGHPAMIEPAILFVSNGNKVTAEQIWNETRLITGANATTFAGNPHAGKFRPLISPWLSRSALFSSATDVAWYLLSDPSDIPAYLLAYLRGKSQPTVESSEVDFNQLGVQFRAYLDFGVVQHDPKGGVMMKGSA